MTSFWILVAVWTALGPFLFMAGCGAKKVYKSNAWFLNDLALIVLCGPVLWITAILLLIQQLKK